VEKCIVAESLIRKGGALAQGSLKSGFWLSEGFFRWKGRTQLDEAPCFGGGIKM
jgi:hypothetical protein